MSTIISHFALLPFELSQAIIDNLSTNRAALHACSLTCKAFLHASRSHLFYSIHLNDKEKATRFFDKICFTDSPTSPCTYVRTLSMYQGSYDRLPESLYDKLPFFATCLPNVTSLTLCGLNWMVLNDGMRRKILSGFPKLQYLALQALFKTSQQANEFISSFPLLTTLCLWTIYLKSYSEPVIPLPRGLKSITLHSNVSRFLNQLLRLESPNISFLEFEDLDLGNAQTASELLKTVGSRLEHLQLADHCHSAVPVNLINLAHNTNLRSVYLALLSSTRDNSSTLDWVSTLFSQITSHLVEDVCLKLRVDEVVDLEVFFSSIERVFIQQHWSNLQRLEIISLGHPLRKPPKPIKVYMPLLDSRGVVLVADW